MFYHVFFLLLEQTFTRFTIFSCRTSLERYTCIVLHVYMYVYLSSEVLSPDVSNYTYNAFYQQVHGHTALINDIIGVTCKGGRRRLRGRHEILLELFGDEMLRPLL